MNKKERQERIDRMIKRGEIYEKAIAAGGILALIMLFILKVLPKLFF
jgi:hypothetical protein